MATKAYNMKTKMFIVGIISLLVCISFLVLKNSKQRIETRQAWNLIVDYDRMCGQLSAMSVTDLSGYLDIITNGKSIWDDKNIKNIVSRERQRLTQEIESEIHKRTGESHVPDPK